MLGQPALTGYSALPRNPIPRQHGPRSASGGLSRLAAGDKACDSLFSANTAAVGLLPESTRRPATKARPACGDARAQGLETLGLFQETRSGPNRAAITRRGCALPHVRAASEHSPDCPECGRT